MRLVRLVLLLAAISATFIGSCNAGLYFWRRGELATLKIDLRGPSGCGGTNAQAGPFDERFEPMEESPPGQNAPETSRDLATPVDPTAERKLELERLYTALRKAHAAGNVREARRVAAEIRRQNDPLAKFRKYEVLFPSLTITNRGTRTVNSTLVEVSFFEVGRSGKIGSSQESSDYIVAPGESVSIDISPEFSRPVDRCRIRWEALATSAEWAGGFGAWLLNEVAPR